MRNPLQKSLTFMSALGLTALSTLAVAQGDDTTLPGDTDAIAPGPQADRSQAFEPSVEFHGFVDGSVSTVFYVGDGAPDDNDPVSFGLDEAELDVTVNPTERLMIQMDLQFAPANISADFDAEEVLSNIVEQAYLTYYPSVDKTGVFVTFGRFNAPVGAEAVDAPDMFQYSHGPLYNQAAPTNVTGLSLGYSTDALTAQFMVLGDWDEYNSTGDFSLAARLDYAIGDGNIGGVLMFNDLVNTEDSGELTFDINGDVTIDDLTLIGEVHFGYLVADLAEGFPEDGDNVSYGVMAKMNYAVVDPFSITARVSYLNRYENLGLIIDSITDAPLGVPRGSSYHGIEATLAGLFTFSENYYGLFEVRVDKLLGDQDNDVIAITPAFELTATF